MNTFKIGDGPVDQSMQANHTAAGVTFGASEHLRIHANDLKADDSGSEIAHQCLTLETRFVNVR